MICDRYGFMIVMDHRGPPTLCQYQPIHIRLAALICGNRWAANHHIVVQDLGRRSRAGITRKNECCSYITKYTEYAEYVEYAEYAEYAY